MTKETRRLTDLVSKMNSVGEVEAVPAARKPRKSKAIIAKPAHGEKGDFLKLTITMAPDVLALLGQEKLRRQAAKEENRTNSAIISEALIAYLLPDGNK